MLTKEDYMKLPKERLAELLMERDREPALTIPIVANPKCYEPGGTCTNPQRDCINCPRKNYGSAYWTETILTTGKENTEYPKTKTTKD